MTALNRIYLACSCVGVLLLACDVGENKLGEESETAGADGSGEGGGGETDSGGETDGAESTNGAEETGMGGGMCEPGDQRPAGDGCNTCTCQDDGANWACTEIACPACEAGDVTENFEGCECECVDGSFVCPEACECTPGDQMPDADGCNTCTCLEDGSWACTDMACPVDDDPFDGPEVAECGGAVPLDPVVINGVTLEGDSLVVDVAYSGGCEMHLLGGCWDHLWAESLPVQTGLTIAHDNADDPCDAFPTDQVTLDLTPIREGYQAAYGPGPATVHVNLAGWSETIVYSF
jgi:hypothetical protein